MVLVFRLLLVLEPLDLIVNELLNFDIARIWQSQGQRLLALSNAFIALLQFRYDLRLRLKYLIFWLNFIV